VVAVDGLLVAGGDRGALPAKVVVDVGRVDEGGAPVGAVVATGAAGVPVVAVARAPGVESSGEGSIVVVEVVEGGLFAGLADVGADYVAGLGSTGGAGVEDPLGNRCRCGGRVVGAVTSGGAGSAVESLG
jgi:hypothetical protein